MAQSLQAAMSHIVQRGGKRHQMGGNGELPGGCGVRHPSCGRQVHQAESRHSSKPRASCRHGHTSWAHGGSLFKVSGQQSRYATPDWGCCMPGRRRCTHGTTEGHLSINLLVRSKRGLQRSCCRVRPRLTMSMKAISAQMVSLANIPLHGRPEVSEQPLSCVTIQVLPRCRSTACPHTACMHQFRPGLITNEIWLHLHRVDFACWCVALHCQHGGRASQNPLPCHAVTAPCCQLLKALMACKCTCPQPLSLLGTTEQSTQQYMGALLAHLLAHLQHTVPPCCQHKLIDRSP